MAVANRYLEALYRPAFTRKFSHPAQEEDSAFVPFNGDNMPTDVEPAHSRSLTGSAIAA